MIGIDWASFGLAERVLGFLIGVGYGCYGWHSTPDRKGNLMVVASSSAEDTEVSAYSTPHKALWCLVVSKWA